MQRASDTFEAGDSAADIPVRASPPAGMCPAWMRQRCEDSVALLERTGVVWVDGPPGAGKTLLAAAVLRARRATPLWLRLAPADREPRRLEQDLVLALRAARRDAAPCPPARPGRTDATTTAGRHVAAQLARIGPCTLVLDAAEQAGPAGPVPGLVEFLATGRAADSKVLVTSRLPPPPGLARLREEGLVARIDETALRLTPDEAQALAGSKIADTPDEEGSEAVQTALGGAEGWLAGFQALLRQQRDGEDPALFDEYLEHELFSDLPPAEQALLLKLTPLAEIPPAVIEYLDGLRGLRRIRRLARGNQLIQECRDGFRFHPLLVAFLRRREAEHGAANGPRRSRRLAEALAAANRPEGAIDQWLTAGAWPQAGDAILRAAPGLARDGAQAHIRDWLERLPESQRRPGTRLHLWYGLVQIPLDGGLAVETLKAALTALRDGGDESGAALAWSGLVEQAWLQWGDFSPARNLLDELDWLAAAPVEQLEPLAAARLTAAAVMLIGLLAPGDPRREHWLTAAETAARMTLPDGERLGILHVLLALDTWVWGDRARAFRSLEQGRVVETRSELSSIHEQMWHAAVAGYHLWFDPDSGAARERIEYALKRAREHGMRLWDFQLQALGACAALRGADEVRARAWLERTRRSTRPAQPTDASFQSWVGGWVVLRSGDAAGAAAFADDARRLIEDRGPVNAQFLARLAVVRSRRLLGRPRAALTGAVGIDRAARGCGMALYQWLARLIMVQALVDCGRVRWADRLLKSTLDDGRARGYMCIPWCTRDELEELCRRGAELGVEPQYLRSLAHANGLPDWQPSWRTPARAWPLRIHALGTLRVETADGQIQVVGKGARLLRLLAAAGPRGLTEPQVIDELWPEADGDRARKAFDTLLHRLRRRLAAPGAVRLEGRRLFLNPVLCWTDVAVLDCLLVEAAGGDISAWHSALELVSGGAPARDWPAPEGAGGLHRRFAASTEHLLQHLVDHDEADAAVEVAQRALATDPSREPRYRRFLEVAAQRRRRHG